MSDQLGPISYGPDAGRERPHVSHAELSASIPRRRPSISTPKSSGSWDEAYQNGQARDRGQSGQARANRPGPAQIRDARCRRRQAHPGRRPSWISPRWAICWRRNRPRRCKDEEKQEQEAIGGLRYRPGRSTSGICEMRDETRSCCMRMVLALSGRPGSGRGLSRANGVARADAVEIVRYENQHSRHMWSRPVSDGQAGLAVVFQGTRTCTTTPGPRPPRAPGLQLKVEATAGGSSTFRPGRVPAVANPSFDPARENVEVYAGDFTVFLPIEQSLSASPRAMPPSRSNSRASPARASCACLLSTRP